MPIQKESTIKTMNKAKMAKIMLNTENFKLETIIKAKNRKIVLNIEKQYNNK